MHHRGLAWAPHRSSFSVSTRNQLPLCVKTEFVVVFIFFVLSFFFLLWAGLPFSKPEVISLLQQGEDPWKVEKESPGGSSLGKWVGNLCKQQSGKWADVRLGDVGQWTVSEFSVLKKWWRRNVKALSHECPLFLLQLLHRWISQDLFSYSFQFQRRATCSCIHSADLVYFRNCSWFILTEGQRYRKRKRWERK